MEPGMPPTVRRPPPARQAPPPSAGVGSISRPSPAALARAQRPTPPPPQQQQPPQQQAQNAYPYSQYHPQYRERDAMPPRPRVSPSPLASSSTGSGFSSYLGSTAGFASKARAALSSASSYVASTATTVASAAAANAPSAERRAAWEEWARDWRDGRKAPIRGEETIHVLPGWAVKRPRKDGGEGAFDLHLSVNGFCTFVRDPGSISRTQRALLSIAKRVAALPAVPLSVTNDGNVVLQSSPSQKAAADPSYPSTMEELSLNEKDGKPPPPPSRVMTTGSSASPKSSPRLSPRLARRLSPRLRPTLTRRPTDSAFDDADSLALAHQFLDTRLRPFWSSVLAYRRITVTIYPVLLKGGVAVAEPDAELFAQEPLFRTTFTTNTQGNFSQMVVINWEHIATHPQAVPLAFADDPANDPSEWGLVIRAELQPDAYAILGGPSAGTPTASGASTLVSGAPPPASGQEGLPYVARRSASIASQTSVAPSRAPIPPNVTTAVDVPSTGAAPAASVAVVAVSKPGGVRIISDLDDTVKHSDILSGTREVFRNVFCRRLDDILVPGMNKLYQDLHAAGLTGLHFVSNSPFELFPVVDQFLRMHQFPSYFSLKLKFYGGRSIVTSLFEPAGQRKRPSVLEILDEFDDSKFILVGDSGEQDLELYTAIAHERPHQIAAIFIRDVTSGRVIGPSSAANQAVVDDLTMTPLNLDDHDGVYGGGVGGNGRGTWSPAASQPPSGAATPTTQSSVHSAEDLAAKTVAELEELSAAEAKNLRRAAEWEARVARAYEVTPEGVRLVFFKDAEEIEDVAMGVLKEESGKHALDAKAQ